MILGTISADGVPTITISAANQDWLAVIDTGFNGDLELPENLRKPLHARYVGRLISALAAGQTIEEDVYVVELSFDGNIIQAEATFVAGRQILIGTHLLRQYHLSIDFVHGKVKLYREFET